MWRRMGKVNLSLGADLAKGDHILLIFLLQSFLCFHQPSFEHQIWTAFLSSSVSTAMAVSFQSWTEFQLLTSDHRAVILGGKLLLSSTYKEVKRIVSTLQLSQLGWHRGPRLTCLLVKVCSTALSLTGQSRKAPTKIVGLQTSYSIFWHDTSYGIFCHGWRETVWVGLDVPDLHPYRDQVKEDDLHCAIYCQIVFSSWIRQAVI